MALEFTGNDSDVVNIGSGSSLANLDPMTCLMWIWWDAIDDFIWSKGNGTARTEIYTGSSDILMERANLNGYKIACFAALSNFSAYSTSKWLFLAMQWDTSKTGSDLHFFMGDLDSAAAEPSSYVQQLLQSGWSTNSDASDPIRIGNQATEGNSHDGKIATFQVLNAYLTPEQIISLQWQPRVVPNTVALLHLGFNGTGTQTDWSGNRNNGSVTGATLAAHPPISVPLMLPSRGDLHTPVSALDIQGNEGRMVFGDI